MKVLLLKDVPGTGRKGETKDVAPGYAKNLLIKRGLATPATVGMVKNAERSRADKLRTREAYDKAILACIETIRKTTTRIEGTANDAGHLFAGISKDVIAASVGEKCGIDFPKDIIMLDQPIKSIGRHEIRLRHAENEYPVIVDVVQPQPHSYRSN